MPIVVTCPKCSTKLSAPESAAGKQVRCPRCGAAAPVPAFEVVEEPAVVDATPAPAPAPKAKPQPVLAEAADDEDGNESLRKKSHDEDDEEERPRKKKKKRYDDDDDYAHDHARRKRRPNKSSGGGRMVAVIVIGGLLLLIGVGAVIIFAVSGSSAFAKRAPVPAGWQQYDNSQAGLKAYLPTKPNEMNLAVNGIGLDRGRVGGGAFGREIEDAEFLSVMSSGTANDPVRVEIYMIRFRNSVPSSVRDKLFNDPNTPVGGETHSTRWLGQKAVEQTSKIGTARAVCVDRTVLVALVAGRNGRATKEEEDGFFDNIELTK